MPAAQRTLSPDDARLLVAERCFERVPGVPDGAVGVELERLAVCVEDPTRHPPLATVRAAAEAAGPLPRGSRVTFEPGGQVELSGPPLPLLEACDAMACDSERLGASLESEGIALVGLGLEPGPLHERVVSSPRYDAMERYFDASGPAGRTMMRGTAAVQVNLAYGDDADVDRQWRIAHDLGPMLAAAFANSPFGDDGPTGWRSSRLAVWWEIDPGRTRPAAGEVGTPGRTAFADYAFAARVMSVRRSDSSEEAQLAPLDVLGVDGPRPRARVADGGGPRVPPDDALPAGAAARLARAPHDRRPPQPLVACRIGGDRRARAGRGAAGDGRRASWTTCAGSGSKPPATGCRIPSSAPRRRRASRPRSRTSTRPGADDETIRATEEYIDRYVSRGECPADFLLGEWHTRGRTLPLPDNCANHEWS